jgi:hypothetical protein
MISISEHNNFLSEHDIGCAKHDKAVAEIAFISDQLDVASIKRDDAVTTID